MMETLHEVVVVCWIDDNRGEELEEAYSPAKENIISFQYVLEWKCVK